MADHLGCHFLTDIRPILLPKSITDLWKKTLNSIRETVVFLLSRYSKITSLLDVDFITSLASF